MVSKTDLAWLGGIIDGEGSVTIFRHTEKNGKVKLRPTVGITNTNPKIISRCLKIIGELGVTVHIQERWTDSEKYATCWQVISRNTTTIKTILEGVRPYLYGKGQVADYVLSFIESRWTQNGKGQAKRYTEYEHRLADSAMAFNKRGVSKILTDYTQYAENIRKYKVPR